jgi:hypothetical protein
MVCPISEKIGLPLQMYQIRCHNDSENSNQPALMLMKDPVVGLCPDKLQIIGGVGTVVVVRKDKLPLTPLELEIICLWHHSLSNRIDEVRWRIQEGAASKQTFQAFYEGFLRGYENATGDEMEQGMARGSTWALYYGHH